MSYQTIVSSDVLAQHIDDSTWIVFDCRFVLGRPQAGRQEYLNNHIKGAYYADLDKDLSSERSADSGRHPLPKVVELESKLKRWGVNQNSQVVVYDNANSALAVRMWWLLQWLGHGNTAVLDGGFQKWCSENRSVQQGEEALPVSSAGDFFARPNDNMWVSTETVLGGLNDNDTVIIDARMPERYSGENETVDPEGGHIPTAINHPLTRNLDQNNCFLPAPELRKMFTGLRQPLMIHSCGSGVTACHNILAMEIAGLSGSRLYVGSWSEWIRSSQRPRAQGLEPGTI